MTNKKISEAESLFKTLETSSLFQIAPQVSQRLHSTTQSSVEHNYDEYRSTCIRFDPGIPESYLRFDSAENIEVKGIP